MEVRAQHELRGRHACIRAVIISVGGKSPMGASDDFELGVTRLLASLAMSLGFVSAGVLLMIRQLSFEEKQVQVR